MTASKRVLDLVLAAVLGVLLLPLLLLTLLLALVFQGQPLFHVAERMKAPGRPFRLWKLRSMRPDPGDAGVSGGDKSDRISPFGHLLRRTRADEMPQLWNVLKGDMSFVGPRPPLRRYVERFPDLYARVLEARPGITGLATLVYHGHEERLLARCATPEETDAVYARRCVPTKARLDLIYLRNRSLRVDLWLIGLTAARALRLLPPGGRLPRPRPRRPRRPKAAQ